MNEADCEGCDTSPVRAGDDCVVRPDGEPSDAPAKWITIARFGNAAEAGFFAHELVTVLDCEPRIEYQDDFDAVGGAWRTRYLLTVPERLAEHGRTQLGAMLDGNREQDQPRPDSDDPFCVVDSTGAAPAPHGANSRINWVPIMLTLAAGSAVLWAGKKAPFARRHLKAGEAGQRDLLDILADGAWVQHSGDESGQRELRIDARGRTATILEDTDGDGRFDRELEFPMPFAER